MSGIQQPNIIEVFDPLDLTDLSVEAGQIDPTQLTAVYPINPGWLSPQVVSGSGSDSIDGSNGAVDDTADLSTLLSSSGQPTTSDQRYYSTIRLYLSGGTVTPLSIAIQKVYASGSAIQLTPTFSLANPSDHTVGPFYFEAGTICRVRCHTVGGSGDAITAEFNGFKSRPGIPLPTIQTPSLLEA